MLLDICHYSYYDESLHQHQERTISSPNLCSSLHWCSHSSSDMQYVVCSRTLTKASRTSRAWSRLSGVETVSPLVIRVLLVRQLVRSWLFTWGRTCTQTKSLFLDSPRLKANLLLVCAHVTSSSVATVASWGLRTTSHASRWS